MRTYLLIAMCSAGACGQLPDKTEVGPEITVRVSPTNASYVDNTDTDPGIRVDTDTGAYDFTLAITSRDGSIEGDGTYDRTILTEIEVTLTLPGFTFPDSPLEPDPNIEGSFARRDMISIPASFMGMSFSIQAHGADMNGVGTNMVDFSVALR